MVQKKIAAQTSLGETSTTVTQRGVGSGQDQPGPSPRSGWKPWGLRDQSQTPVGFVQSRLTPYQASDSGSTLAARVIAERGHHLSPPSTSKLTGVVSIHEMQGQKGLLWFSRLTSCTTTLPQINSCLVHANLLGGVQPQCLNCQQ